MSDERQGDGSCAHGLSFAPDALEILDMPEDAVRRRWPRLDGPCPLGCGYDGIAYASEEHYFAGGW